MLRVTTAAPTAKRGGAGAARKEVSLSGRPRGAGADGVAVTAALAGACRTSAEEGHARLHLPGSDHALLGEDARDAVQPVLEVTGAEVVGGIHALDPVAELVDVVEPGGAGGAHDGHHRRLPRRMEWRLVLLALHRTEPVHAAEIVDAVHRRSSRARILPRS